MYEDEELDWYKIAIDCIILDKVLDILEKYDNIEE